MTRVGRNSLSSGRASSHCCMQHLVARGPGQVAVLVVAPLGQQQVDVAEAVEHREGVRDDRRVVVLLVEDRRAVQQVVERLEEPGARMSAPRTWGTASAEQRSPYSWSYS